MDHRDLGTIFVMGLEEKFSSVIGGKFVSTQVAAPKTPVAVIRWMVRLGRCFTTLNAQPVSNYVPFSASCPTSMPECKWGRNRELGDAMMTSTPNANVESNAVPLNGLSSICAQQTRDRADFHPSRPSDEAIFNPIVQVDPVESVKRLGVGWHRWFTENIYSPVGNKVEFRFQGPVHLLVVYREGARRDGETTIEGLLPSRVRSFVNKLTFVPAGHAYREWHQTSASTQVTFLYLDPAKLPNPDDPDRPYTPRMYFEDSVVCETAAKIRNAIESGEQRSAPYLEALYSVLAHELSRPDRDLARTSPLNRGGLASWQKRVVVGYLEEHLSEQICLDRLARLIRLSEHHFCRAFKQSFGIPPHQYHVQRRMESAKVLLADRKVSVTEIALTLGYSQTSSFSVAFRKTTGWTPREYRREFK
jgi:AraC family transcriptional regulator